jgi:hypothetical protein
MATGPIAVHVGDLAAAERLVTTLPQRSANHALNVWNASERCQRGTLLLARDAAAGPLLLQVARNRELHRRTTTEPASMAACIHRHSV